MRRAVAIAAGSLTMLVAGSAPTRPGSVAPAQAQTPARTVAASFASTYLAADMATRLDDSIDVNIRIRAAASNGGRDTYVRGKTDAIIAVLTIRGAIVTERYASTRTQAWYSGEAKSNEEHYRLTIPVGPGPARRFLLVGERRCAWGVTLSEVTWWDGCVDEVHLKRGLPLGEVLRDWVANEWIRVDLGAARPAEPIRAGPWVIVALPDRP